MDEPIPTTHALKQDTPRHLFEEWDNLPGECATVCEKPSEHIMLDIGFSPEEQSADQPGDQPAAQPEEQPEEQPDAQPEEQPDAQPEDREKDKTKTQCIPS